MANEVPAIVVADLILNFLDNVAEVHKIAVAIHADHPHGYCDITQMSTTLTATVERLHVEINREDSADVLARTCVKLGQHLLVRLDRVQAYEKSSGHGADLRNAWPVAAVEALGDRIRDLQYQLSLTSP